MTEQHDFDIYLHDVLEWAKRLRSNLDHRKQTYADEERNALSMLAENNEQFIREIESLRQTEAPYEQKRKEIEQIRTRSIELFQEYVRLEETLSRLGTADDEKEHEKNAFAEASREEAFGGEQIDRRVPPGGHRLPPLPYDYDALEPYISEKVMRLHHDRHHQSYVDGLNKAELKMQEARRTGNFELIRHWEREAAFHGAGHYLHTIFWNVMSPNGGGEPKGLLRQQIDRDFGSFQSFKRHFGEAAKNVEGVGWAILVWAPRAHRLVILQAEKHQYLSQWDVIPLLVLDVWEHAYYLQYETDRAAYVDRWWNVVNWNEVAMRFYTAQKVKWEPY